MTNTFNNEAFKYDHYPEKLVVDCDDPIALFEAFRFVKGSKFHFSHHPLNHVDIPSTDLSDVERYIQYGLNALDTQAHDDPYTDGAVYGKSYRGWGLFIDTRVTDGYETLHFFSFGGALGRVELIDGKLQFNVRFERWDQERLVKVIIDEMKNNLCKLLTA